MKFQIQIKFLTNISFIFVLLNVTTLKLGLISAIFLSHYNYIIIQCKKKKKKIQTKRHAKHTSSQDPQGPLGFKSSSLLK